MVELAGGKVEVCLSTLPTFNFLSISSKKRDQHRRQKPDLEFRKHAHKFLL